MLLGGPRAVDGDGKREAPAALGIVPGAWRNNPRYNHITATIYNRIMQMIMSKNP